jgi:hypothetical protein
MSDKVRIATWNMGGGEPMGGPGLEATTNVLQKLHKLRVEILLGQEAQENENIRAIKALGYRVHQAGPESIVAWLPHWHDVFRANRVLNPNNPFFRPGRPDKPIYVHMANTRLCNKDGISLDLGSYHTPSSVQKKNPPPNRMAALRESMDTLEELAKESLCDASCYGGDDNVDERKAYGPWDFMLKRATGLKLVRAPKNTLRDRKVDDFRVRRLKPIGNGVVLDGPGHHNPFVQDFELPD